MKINFLVFIFLCCKNIFAKSLRDWENEINQSSDWEIKIFLCPSGVIFIPIWVDNSAKEFYLDGWELWVNKWWLELVEKVKKRIPPGAMTHFLSIWIYLFFRSCKSSKAATPKKSKRSILSELAGSPSKSAKAWKDSMKVGLHDLQKPKLRLDPTIFDQLMTSPEKKLKNRTLEGTNSVSEENSVSQTDQTEKDSGLIPSTGRVSLWLIGLD